MVKFISNKNFFQPRARLLLQLGDKLIKNENIALLELIKNCYDADAKKVKVLLERVINMETGVIDVIDDGEGMNIETIENVWLEPGSDNKAKLFKKGIRTKKYNRLPIGEKGIGRFGVHKLGNKIELITRKKNENEVVVKIDWIEFEKNKYLKDAKVEVYERTPEYFLRSRSGTRIRITDLRTSWDRRMIRDFYKSVFTLNSPFTRAGNFKVEINIDDKTLIEDLPRWEDIKEFALWHFKCTIKGSEIQEFLYEFIPWDTMTKVDSKIYTLNDKYVSDRSSISIKSRVNKKEEVIINLSKNYGSKDNPKHIGEIKFEGYIFDRDKTTLELNSQMSISYLKQYLDEQGGISVYRDNIRINEYGEKGNDWLNLDLRRVNIPTKRVSNNIIIGVIDLKLEECTALIEKTNREGFIENEAFNDFCAAILYALDLIERLRKDDKDQIRKKYNPSERDEPVLFYLSELKTLIDKNIKDEPLRKEIVEHLEKIESDYEDINNRLLTSAGAGLTLAVGVHEIQKVIQELNVFVQEEKVPDKILKLLTHLDELIEGYSNLLRLSDKVEENIIELVDGALFNVEYRLGVHDIEIIKNYKNFNSEINVNCVKRLLLGAIINIIDNSIYWLERKNKKLSLKNQSFKKRILIELFMDRNKFIDILIADNGFGFGLPKHQITKPFITDKPDGMGLGLHIANEAMKVQKGILYFPEINEYDIEPEFQHGAIVVIKVKQNKNDSAK